MAPEGADADVLVVGAGPAGATIARLLAEQGRRVLVASLPVETEGRLEMLPPAALPIAVALGLGPLLDDPAIARPCLGIRRIWGGVRDIDAFLMRPGGIGYVLDRPRFDARLRDLATAKGAIMRECRVFAARRRDGRIVLHASDRTRSFELEAPQVVDATGRRCSIARRLGAKRLLADRLLASRESRDASGDDAVAGPIWLDVEGFGTTWRYAMSGPGGLREAWRISRAPAQADRARRICVDASSARLDKAADHGWIAVGDAASCFDPITSQGLHNALSSALAAARSIAAAALLQADAASAYAEAVTAAFLNSEAQREEVYAALRTPQSAPSA